MSKILVRINSLEAALGLKDKSPVEHFYDNPSLEDRMIKQAYNALTAIQQKFISLSHEIHM